MAIVDAVVLAGSSKPGVDGNRAMQAVAGKPMAQWVVDALRSSGSVGRIAIVGDVQVDGADLTLPSGSSMVDNIRIGVEALDNAQRVMSVCVDIPFITAEGIDDFVGRGLETGGELVFPIISKASCEAQFPGMQRTYLKTAEGTFTGGNITLISGDLVRNNWELISQAYAARKQVLRLAGLIGWGVLFRVILGQIIPSTLKLTTLEQAASRVMGARAVALQTEFAGIGEDLDKPEDFEAAELILGQRDM